MTIDTQLPPAHGRRQQAGNHRWPVTASVASIVLATTLWVNAAAAEPAGSQTEQAADSGIARIEVPAGKAVVERLQKLRPGLPIESVTASQVPGILAVNLGDGSTYHATEDGRYLFAGDLLRLDPTELVNVSERARDDKRRELLAQVDQSQLVTFSADKVHKAEIYVFTDVDCGYCRKLHLEVPALNARGIDVHYLAYPRAGVGSQSYDKIVSAWCSEDPRTALTQLKAGQTIPSRTCENPVADQYGLGRKLGITGTPAIVLEDGRLLPGYMPADQLAQAVGL